MLYLSRFQTEADNGEIGRQKMKNQERGEDLIETYTKRTENARRLLLVLLSVAFAIAGFYLVIYSWKELNLRNLKKVTLEQLLILGPLVLEYFLIASVFICFTAFLKRGFRNIKSIQNGGVLNGFFLGFEFWISMFFLFLFFGGWVIGASGFIEVLIMMLILSILFGLVGFFVEIKKTGNKPRIRP